MLFIVIERFKSRGAAAEVYRRFAERGRMLPDGLKYLDSWVEENLDRCFQLMETDDAKLFKQWIACWQDLVDFEVIPVINSADAQRQAGP
jgi:Domain of unknown function (DUF3303)